jgi:raffinose/stachyose/melibiose transport system substrate-binding protein
MAGLNAGISREKNIYLEEKRMKKNAVLLIPLTVFLVLLLAACGGNGSKTAAAKKNIVLMNAKIEIDEGLKAAAAAYMEQHPDVVIEVVSLLESPGAAELKTRFASGDGPDIFPLNGYKQFEIWEDQIEDLSDQSWAPDIDDLARRNMPKPGKVFGMPVCMEGGGYIYNKRMFKEAGITEIPRTRSALAEAAKKLQAAGFTPLSAEGGWYAMGTYYVNYGFTNQSDPIAFINGLDNGTKKISGDPEFVKMAEYYKWESSQIENLFSFDFQTVVANFANENAAILFGGVWNQITLDQINPGMEVGFMPVPITDDAEANDFLVGNIFHYWCVNKDSPAKQEGKDFLAWLVTTPEGQKFMTKDMGLIPAISTFGADAGAVGPLGADFAGYAAKGKVKGIYVAFYPNGGLQAFGEVTQKLAAGKLTVDEYLAELQSEWERLSE